MGKWNDYVEPIHAQLKVGPEQNPCTVDNMVHAGLNFSSFRCGSDFGCTHCILFDTNFGKVYEEIKILCQN